MGRIFLLIAVVIAAPCAFAQQVDVGPEKTMAVNVSNRDVNRLACSSPIDSVTYSKEKPAVVEVKDANNVMVKFKIMRQGDKELKVTQPLDMFISCGGEVFSLVLYPVDRDATTVRLGSNLQASIKTINKEWGALPIEDRIRNFTLCVYRHDCPNGFASNPITQNDGRRQVKLFKDVEIIGQFETVAPGTGLKAVEYALIAKKPTSFNEKDFLNNVFGNITGVTVDPLVVPANGVARLIIIERSDRDAN